MFKRLSLSLSRASTGWLALLALVIFVLFVALVLPAQAARADENSAGATTPDLSIYYSARDLYRWAEAYGPLGRQAYVRARLTFDVIWPLVYTFFLVTATSWLYRRAFAAGSAWQSANLVPLMGMLFDFLENFSTSMVMLRFPEPTQILDSLAGVFTMVKWALMSASLILLVVGFAIVCLEWIKNRAGV
jgi:hypothetical protein